MSNSGLGIRRIHHIAFAHKEPSVLDIFEDVFGLSCLEPQPGPGFVERMFPVGEAYLQALEATGPGTVDRFVERRGAALHHVAFEVEDIKLALDALKQRGTKLVDNVPRPGGAGTTVAFLHPSACGGLLVELVQPDLVQPELVQPGREHPW
jgi:methylmalonyl-CoA/ethylmalonyl-CoA epimerase